MHCAPQEQSRRTDHPNKNPSTGQQSDDRGKKPEEKPLSNSLACSVSGFPTATRVFMNHNEGFFVGSFTLLLVVVTAWLVWATIKLWRGAEDTAKRQLRAYISVESGMNWRQDQRRKTVFEFRPVVENNGQTPANKVRIISMIEVRAPIVPPDFDFDIPDTFVGALGSVTTIGAGKTKIHSRILPAKLTRAELKEIAKGSKCFHVWGVVRYDDIFDQPHTTNFSFLIFVGRKRSQPIWHSTERHNDAD